MTAELKNPLKNVYDSKRFRGGGSNLKKACIFLKDFGSCGGGRKTDGFWVATRTAICKQRGLPWFMPIHNTAVLEIVILINK